MLTLDEAIKHCEEVAEKKEREAEYRQETQGDMFKFFDDLSKSVGGEGVENDALNECLECANEHRQLAKWLRELKAYKDARVGCEYCKHNFREQHERPCSLCQRNFMDMFERKVNADDSDGTN